MFEEKSSYYDDFSSKEISAEEIIRGKSNEVKISETPVLVGGKVVVLNELFQEISGVVIVSTGADNLSVKLDLMNAATTLLCIDDSKVQILTGK